MCYTLNYFQNHNFNQRNNQYLLVNNTETFFGTFGFDVLAIFM